MSTIEEIGSAFAKVIIVFGPIYLLAGEGYKWAYFLALLVFLSILLQRYKKTGRFATSIASNSAVTAIQAITRGLGGR